MQIDLKPRHLSLRYPMEVNLWGDAKTTLAALLPHLHQTADLGWQEGIADAMSDWESEVAGAAAPDGRPGEPACSCSTAQRTVARRRDRHRGRRHDRRLVRPPHRLGPNMMGNLSGRLATMLAAMPYAIAAKFAFPERPVVCTIGDGAFQMLGMNGLLTIKRHWPEWENPTFIVLVLHNNDLNQVSWEMREAGDPWYDTSQLLEDMDYAGYARLLGLTGIRVDDPTTSRPHGTRPSRPTVPSCSMY